VREGHRTVMNALIQFVAVLSKATPFGDAVKACKVGGEGTEVDGEGGRHMLRIWVLHMIFIKWFQ